MNKTDWEWCYKMAEKICNLMDFEKFGVKGFYIFGSTKNASAGPAMILIYLSIFAVTKSKRNVFLFG
ncbi:MAG: hypothetical protein P9M11_05305 [Candidatus Tenebribacter burtonii]|nr:hypothetical protein [Candidatus Tenebribacter burtonii]